LGMEEPKFAPQAQEVCEGDTCANQPYAELVGNGYSPRFRLVFPQGVPLDLEGRLEIRFMVNMELGGFPIQFEHTIETALPVTDDPAPVVTLGADYSAGITLVEGMPLDVPLTVLDPAFNNLTVDLLLDGQPWNGVGGGACTVNEFMTGDYWSLSGNTVFWDDNGVVMNGDGELWAYSQLTYRVGSAPSVTLTIAPDVSAQGKELLVIAYSNGGNWEQSLGRVRFDAENPVPVTVTFDLADVQGLAGLSFRTQDSAFSYRVESITFAGVAECRNLYRYEPYFNGYTHTPDYQIQCHYYRATAEDSGKQQSLRVTEQSAEGLAPRVDDIPVGPMMVQSGQVCSSEPQISRVSPAGSLLYKLDMERRYEPQVAVAAQATQLVGAANVTD